MIKYAPQTPQYNIIKKPKEKVDNRNAFIDKHDIGVS